MPLDNTLPDIALAAAQELEPDLTDAIRFVGALFPEPGLVHMRSVAEPADGRGAQNHHYELGAGFETTLRDFLSYCQAERRAAYVLPGYVVPGGTHKDAVTALWTVLVDLDKGNTEANLEQLEEAIGPATVIVESGGTTEAGTPKLHAYWRLDAPATGAEIDRVCRVRETLALRFGGDPAFKQQAQVIRIPGSLHFKGQPKLVRLRKVRPGQHYSLSHIAGVIGDTAAPAPQPAPEGGGFLDFSNVTVLHSDVDRVMTAPIHSEGADDITRFEGASIALGHFIRMIREGRMTEEEAWEAAKGWNQATLIPPWPEDRLRHDWRRLRERDINDHGPLILPRPVIEAKAPQGWSILDWQLDRFERDKAPARRWLVENLIPLGTPGLLAAVGDAGKSMLALSLALAVTAEPANDVLAATGPKFFGQRVLARGAAVILTAEDDADEVHRRVAALDPTNRAKGKPVHVVPLLSTGGARAILVDGPQGPQPTEFWAELCRQLETIPDLALVVFDPLSSFVGADINKDNLAGAALMTMLAELATRTGAAVMMVHHFNKANVPSNLTDARGAIRGAGALVDNGRWAVTLWEAGDDKAAETLKALGRNSEIGQAGVVYQGGLAKGNAPGAKTMRTLARNPKTGLLEDVTDLIRAAKPGQAEFDDAVYRALKTYQETHVGFSTPLGRTAAWKKCEPAFIAAGVDASKDQIEGALRRLLEQGRLAEAGGRGGSIVFEPV